MSRRTSATAQAARAAQIVGILSANGFEYLVEAAGLRPYAPIARAVRRAWPGPAAAPSSAGQPLPVRLREVLEQLGPTFVKAGQLLALRPDRLPPAYAEALRALQYEAHPFAAEQARAIIAEELGRPVEEVFADFDDEPFAAASLSQVHRAELPDGRVVAVKVQRPGVAEAFDADLALLALAARRLVRRSSRSWSVDPVATVAELDRWSRRELDFRGEARTAQAVGRMFAQDPDVVIPEVDFERTTRRVLTMDLIEGIHPTDAAALLAAGIDPDEVVEVGTHAMVRQVFTFGLFHADPHPGNVLVRPGGQVAFLDFGLFGRVDRRERRRVGLVLWAIIEEDYDAVADLLLRLGELGPATDEQGFRDAVADILSEWLGEGQTTSVPRLMLRALGAGGRFHVGFSTDLVLLARALISLEGTVARLKPGTRLIDLLDPALPELRRALLPDTTTLRSALKDKRYDYLALALDLPDVLAGLLPDLATRAERAATGPDAPPAVQVTVPPARRRRGGAVGTAVLAAAVGAAAARAAGRWGSPR